MAHLDLFQDPPETDRGVDDLPVTIRRSVRAKRIQLRITPDGRAELVLPEGAPEERGRAFLEEKAGWLWQRLSAIPRPRPFADGQVIPVLGEDHRITHLATSRGATAFDAGPPPTIRVTGDPHHLNRRVSDLLKRRAKAEIAERAHPLADLIGRKIKRISVKDTTSRWGSCSHDGVLSFSWRLVMAPERVLAYVVAHEVAHLAEMNHSQRFWSIVHRLDPGYDAARVWLKRHGRGLHALGNAPR
ncbi:MAG: M48 family metallopeptidase [Alphaproteobacteria bacterium]|nr:M48 family metallopeptidase [Alphaproteobacteria bacterium]